MRRMFGIMFVLLMQWKPLTITIVVNALNIFFTYQTVWNSQVHDILVLVSKFLHGRKMFRKSNISYALIRTHMCASQGLRNVSFSENIAYALNEWSPSLVNLQQYTDHMKYCILIYSTEWFQTKWNGLRNLW